MNVILQGVVGSQAFGLATADSDVDRAGIYARPTEDLFKLNQPPRRELSTVTTNPDSVWHEADKFCHLAARCNPSILELLWLGKYEQQTSLGWQLVTIRNHFLAAPRVKGAYLGYANEQMLRLSAARTSRIMEDAARKPKMEKHARHVARLLYQGYQLYRTSTLPVLLPNAEVIRRIGVAAGEGDMEPLRSYFTSHEDNFNNNSSPLPEEPDYETIDDWLHRLRMAYLPGQHKALRKLRLGDLFTDDLTQPVLTYPTPDDAE